MRALIGVVAVGALALLSACASGPVDGAVGGIRRVSVGETVAVRLPATVETQEWKVSWWDRDLVRIAQHPRLVGREGERSEWVARLIMERRGETEMEFERVAVGPGDREGFVGQRRMYFFRIVN